MHTGSLSFLVLLALCSLLPCAQGFNTTVGASESPVVVTNSSIARITSIADDMYNRWYELDAACSPHAVFALAYLYMTANAKKLVSGNYFDDGNKMVDFVEAFAGRYISAIDAWRAGNKSSVSQPWRVAFGIAESNYSDVTQDLTLGMNAHINYDLPIAAYEQGYAVPRWSGDYYRINDLMAQIDDNITHGLGRYDPLFYSQNFLVLIYFELSIEFVTSWRTSAYATALGYQAAPLSFPLLRATNEVAIATGGVLIQAALIPKLTETATGRIAYCQANHYPLVFN